tara:strand:- start:58 stop:255 length:198 start_codon:yes stop_codon:yes gene_type:complete
MVENTRSGEVKEAVDQKNKKKYQCVLKEGTNVVTKVYARSNEEAVELVEYWIHTGIVQDPELSNG